MPRILAFVVMGCLLGPATASPQAEAPPASPSDAILAQFEAGNYSQAVRTAEKLVKEHPEDAQVRYLCGVTLMTTLQNQAAAREFEKVIQLDPGFAEAHANLGLVRDLLGDEEGARKALERSLELDPANADARRDLLDLTIRHRIRKGERTSHAPGTAGHAMDAFLEMVAQGKLAEAFQQHVDPAVIEKILRKAGGGVSPSDDELDDFFSGMRRGWQGQILRGGGRYRGFEVRPPAPDAEPAGGEGEVQAYVLIEKVTTAQDVAQMKRFMNSPEFDQFISPDIKMIFQGLEPQDREAFFQRLEGYHQNQLLPVSLRVFRDEKGHWRIRDALLGDANLVQISFMTALDKIDAFAGLSGNPLGGSGGRSSYDTGYNIGRIAGILIGLIVAIAFLVRIFRKA